MSDLSLIFNKTTVYYESHHVPVIDSLSMQISAGEKVALAGLNGSGKTTLLMASAGLLPHEGEIRVCGIPVTQHSHSAIREKIGFLFNVPEDQLLFPKVIEDVSFGLLCKGVAKQDAFDQSLIVLGTLGISHLADFPLHHLSHGQKQRVALAGALVTKPPILLFDEPTSGLDPIGKRDLAVLLTNLDAAMLVATHDLEFAEQVCSRIILLENGRFVPGQLSAKDVRSHWGLNKDESGIT